MQPGYQGIIPNNISAAFRKKRDKWAEELGVKSDEMLVFRAIGTGNTLPLKIKSTARGHENENFTEIKPVPASRTIPMVESIADPEVPGSYVQLAYYEGGFFPGKKTSPVIFKGFDETVINVVPDENPALYDFLTFSPRLKDGFQRVRVTPQFELLRPDAEAEANVEDDENLATCVLAIRDASYDTLKYLAPKLFLPAETATEGRMRKNFNDYAKLRPANAATLMQLFEADETLVFQHVEDAVAADIVAINPEKAMWVLSNNQQPITPASPGRNNIDQLVGFLVLEDDQPTLKQIIALLGAEPVAKPPKKKKA